jgi:aldose 1-epimerase
VLDHILWIDADNITPVNENLIPTGSLQSVKGTAYDFLKPKRIGEDMQKVEPGYDMNYVINHEIGQLSLCASVLDPKSGRKLEMLTTEPGVQLYTGNWLESPINGFRGPFPRFGAVCLEAQHYPDSPNQPQFPSTVYDANRPYKQTTVYRFSGWTG